MDFERLVARGCGEGLCIQQQLTLKGDASSRRYHRLVLHGEGSPSSVVVMELPTDAFVSDEATDGPRPTELPFVNLDRCLAARGIRVPEIILDATTDGALLLEDLGDRTLACLLEGLDHDDWRAWYEAAVDLLVSMHQKMWPVPEECLAKDRSFDYELLRWELDHYREWGCEALRGGALAPLDKKDLDREFDQLARRIADLPVGFVHRDYQSRNLMVVGDGPTLSSFVVIDFQDALKGPRVYDLVALLNDSYVSLDWELKRRLIERYAQAMNIDLGELLVEFHLVTVQRKLKDGGRFVFIDRVKGNPKFLPFIDDSFARVRDSLERLDELSNLKALLGHLDAKHFSTAD